MQTTFFFGAREKNIVAQVQLHSGANEGVFGANANQRFLRDNYYNKRQSVFEICIKTLCFPLFSNSVRSVWLYFFIFIDLQVSYYRYSIFCNYCFFFVFVFVLFFFVFFFFVLSFCSQIVSIYLPVHFIALLCHVNKMYLVFASAVNAVLMFSTVSSSSRHMWKTL